MKKAIRFCLVVAFFTVLFSCKPSANTPTTGTSSQLENKYAYGLITEANGWHILGKDSFMTTLGVNNWPGNIFFANNTIYYSTGIYSGGNYPTNNYFYKKCNLDGSNVSHILFPKYQDYTNGSKDLPMVFTSGSALYNYSAGGYLYQQQINADGSNLGSFTEWMGYNYFAGKFSSAVTFSPSANCFIGLGYGYTNVVEVANKVVKPYLWANPGHSDIPFNPTPVFDENYSKTNPNHYRVFGASIGKDNAHSYTNNPCDIAVHCMIDTAKAINFGYPSTYYANAILMDTIHYEANKYVSQLVCATDDQNLYVFAVNIDKVGTVLASSLVIYDKNTFVRKKYIQNITMPSTVSQNILRTYCQMLVVPSKNYLAILAGSSHSTQNLIKIDLTNYSTTDLTPTLPTNVYFGGGFFENNGRIYTQVAGQTVSTKDYCSNIIYFE